LVWGDRTSEHGRESLFPEEDAGAGGVARIRGDGNAVAYGIIWFGVVCVTLGSCTSVLYEVGWQFGELVLGRLV
jgi:hypothetical protein